MTAGRHLAIDPRRVANTRATDRTRHELGNGKPPHDVGLPYHAATAHRFGSERMPQELAVANSIGEKSSSDSQNSKTPLVRRSNERRGGVSSISRYYSVGTLSNQMLLNFGRTKSPGRSSHEIREWLASVVGKTHRNASANLFWAFVMSALRLIDTCSGSPKGHYVKRSFR